MTSGALAIHEAIARLVAGLPMPTEVEQGIAHAEVDPGRGDEADRRCGARGRVLHKVHLTVHAAAPATKVEHEAAPIVHLAARRDALTGRDAANADHKPSRRTPDTSAST